MLTLYTLLVIPGSQLAVMGWLPVVNRRCEVRVCKMYECMRANTRSRHR